MSEHDEYDDDDTALLGELGEVLRHDPGAVPPPERVAAVRAAAARMGSADEVADRRASRRRFLLTGGVAAGVGAVAGYLVQGTRDDEEPAAVPMEQITFTGASPPPAEVSASALINHTWGTELVLDLTGLAAGTTYDVVFETTTGSVGAGSLLAVADVVMRCRFNAAPLRTDVRAIELRDPEGTAVLRSDLPVA